MRSLSAVVVLAAVCVSHLFAQAQQMPGKPPMPKMPGAPGERGTAKTGEQLVKVRALTDVSLVKPGETFHLAFVFDIEPAWHIYWKNSGESGGPTEIKVQAPQGFAIGRTLFPRPVAIKTEDGVSYGYEGQTVIFIEVTAVEDATPGTVRFSASENWLVCKDVCLIGRASQTIPVEVVSPSGPLMPRETPAPEPVVADFKKRLPQDLDLTDGAEISFDGKSFTARIPASGHTKAEFFPDDTPGVTYGEVAVKKAGDQLVVTVPVTVKPQNSLGEPLRIAGVIGAGTSPTDPCYEFELPLPEDIAGGG